MLVIKVDMADVIAVVILVVAVIFLCAIVLVDKIKRKIQKIKKGK